MSRRKRNTIFVCCLLFFSVLVIVDHLRSPEPPAFTKLKSYPDYDLNKYHGKVFKVIKAIDGDTIDIKAADGKKLSTRIRLWGVDTPETKDPRKPAMYFGKEASDFTAEKALDQDVTIFLDTERPNRDKYNRLLAYVQLPDGQILNELLIKNGFGYADTRFDCLYMKKYINLQSDAQKQKIGLWQHVKKEQLPKWLQDKNPNLLK